MKKLIGLFLCVLFVSFGFFITAKASEPEVTDIEKEQLALLLSVDSTDILSVEVVYDFCDEPSFFTCGYRTRWICHYIQGVWHNQ